MIRTRATYMASKFYNTERDALMLPDNGLPQLLSEDQISEDIELGSRLHAHGYKAVFIPENLATGEVCGSLSGSGPSAAHPCVSCSAWVMLLRVGLRFMADTERVAATEASCKRVPLHVSAHANALSMLISGVDERRCLRMRAACGGSACAGSRAATSLCSTGRASSGTASAMCPLCRRLPTASVPSLSVWCCWASRS